jgi:protein ImuB
MSRIACLQVPLFPLAARLRSEPVLKDDALAVLEGQGNRARVVAATRTARKSGVKPGMTLPQARALLPGLVARARDPECERAAQEALLEVAESFSPRVEDGGEGCVYLDVTGLEHHFPAGDAGHPGGSERAAGEAMAGAAEAAGVPAWVGIAGGKLAARVAAEEGAGPTVVPAGEEAAFLAPLPLHRLCPEVRTAATLESWGVASVGDLARLPEAEVASRLGAAGRRLHVTARGEDPRPLSPWQPPPAFREGMDLEWPLVALEPFLFVARAALERLCRRLEARGFACRRLGLDLRLEPDGHDSRSVHLPAATADAKVLLTLVRLDMEARPPGAAVAGVAVDAHPHEPRSSQLSIFGPEALAPDRLATTVARLFALLGPDRVGSPRAPDGHRPERLELVPYEPPPPPLVREEASRPGPSRSGRGMGLLTVRVLRPPVALEVLTAGGPEGGAAGVIGEPAATYGEPEPVERLLSVRSTAGGKRPKIDGRVRVAAGPWRLEEGWWSDAPVERDYWDVELTGGGLYRIYRERDTGEWFADGMYD